MIKFNVKILKLAVFLIVFLFSAVIVSEIASAKDVLPKGGSSFDTAVEIGQGAYQGGALKDKEVEYFYVNAKPGQEVKIAGAFTSGSTYGANCILYLYNENREEIGGSMESSYESPALITVSWLPNSDKDLYKYYIRAGSYSSELASYSLDVSLQNCYDAQSEVDAGDTFDKAMTLSSGEYKAYLSGSKGTDTKDFYKVSVEKGKTLTAKVTPQGEAAISLTLYDGNRQELKAEYASNPGAIITNSASIAESGDAFISVTCDELCSSNLALYTLDIATEGEPVEEVGDSEEETYNKTEAEELAKDLVKKGRSWLLILGIVAAFVIILIIGVVAYFLLKKKKKAKDSNIPSTPGTPGSPPPVS